MYDQVQDNDVVVRLNNLLNLNAETARQQQLFSSNAQRRAFQMMQRPVNFERTFAAFGAFLGTFPVAAIYLRIYFHRAGDIGWLMIFFVVANILTALAGYFFGALVGKFARNAQQYDWITMTVFLTLVGGAWGMISGFIGGLAIFIVGAFFGGAIGSVVGALAMPVFAITHRLNNIAGFIERRQLIALAGGISLTAAAYIFGM